MLTLAAQASLPSQISSVSVIGSGTPPQGVRLNDAGNGVWSGPVTIHNPAEAEYFWRSVVFTINDTLTLGRVPGTRNLTKVTPGAKCEGVRLNNGTYTIGVDTRNATYSVTAPVDSTRISVFGSSVANGEGAPGKKGYALQFNDELTRRNALGYSPFPFHISGISIGGHTTGALLARYDDLLNDFGRFAVIGLSMGNEGIHESTDKEKTFSQFRDNMLRLIERIKADGKIPVVVNNYTRADYTPQDYEAIRRINLLIHGWDVASVNSLGAIDDGHGRWSKGYLNDPGHPNGAGHREFALAFVPSLFDALAAGKPQPERITGASMKLGNGRTAHFVPESQVHPFTTSVGIKGSKPGRIITLSHADGEARVEINPDGTVSYITPQGQSITSAQPVMADGRFHTLTLTHYHARGCTMLYADSTLCGSVAERLVPKEFTFGDARRKSAAHTFSEITFWRSGMNADEIAAHLSGDMLKSSLELYSPMHTDRQGRVANLAQSLNTLEIYKP